MQKNFNHYKEIETRIKNRLEKVRSILNNYKTESEKIRGKWTDADRHTFRNWNRFHDIETALEIQLRNNYFEYQEFCFDNFGISVYNL